MEGKVVWLRVVVVERGVWSAVNAGRVERLSR
jgi:hypothetical protein